MRFPKPVLFNDKDTITAATISQMSGLANPLRESVSACAGLPGLVTPVMATSAMAMTANAAMGIALPMIATIVPVNRANRCHALGVTPAGTGMTNQMTSVSTITNAVGSGLGKA